MRVNFCSKTKAIAVLLLAVSLSCHLATSAAQGTHRIVAIGDVHGAYSQFVAILQKTSIINAQNRWSAVNTTLVQCGDLLDRGAQGRAVLDLLMTLEKQAGKTSGRLVSILGNHEMMNIIGDLRYVVPEDYDQYANAETEKRTKEAYQQYVAFRKKRAGILKQQESIISEAEWRKNHPAGYLEQRDAFAPTGKYGRWLRSRNAVVEMSGIIFVHGGIHPSLSQMKVKDINNRIHEEIAAHDKMRAYLIEKEVILPFYDYAEALAAVKEEWDVLKASATTDPQSSSQHLRVLETFLAMGGWLTMSPHGPLWFRGYAEWHEEEGDSNIASLIQAFHATAFVVGHTIVKAGQIASRFNNRVYLIDAGMLDGEFYPGGKPSALQITGKEFQQIYLDEAPAPQTQSQPTQ